MNTLAILKIHFSGGDAEFVLMLIGLHAFLAAATLGLGDQTLCDLLNPFRRIFSISFDSLLEGVLDLTLSVPKAIFLAFTIYLRAYILLVRLVFMMVLALIPVLIVGEIIIITLHEIRARISESMLTWSIIGAWSFSYWRIDGEKLFINIKNNWRC